MSSFTVYPAIDLRQGKVVRLVQGDPRREKIYDIDPVVTAQRWLDAGAKWLHVVNLDGALSTKFGSASDDQVNWHALEAVMRVASNYPYVKVQFGGGVRSLEDIANVLNAGAARVIIGTAAVRDHEFAASAVQKYLPERVCVGIDARDGEVKVNGWQSGTGVLAETLAVQMIELGVKAIIFTNIAQDGTGAGVDLASTLKLARAARMAYIACGYGERDQFVRDLQVIASGGVNTLDHIRAVRQAGLNGVIVGRALYEGKFTLQEALEC
jgi:phosphoribosylformimino-5-aminoimidazole carboxamide ribotide isomerase